VQLTFISTTTGPTMSDIPVNTFNTVSSPAGTPFATYNASASVFTLAEAGTFKISIAGTVSPSPSSGTFTEGHIAFGSQVLAGTATLLTESLHVHHRFSGSMPDDNASLTYSALPLQPSSWVDEYVVSGAIGDTFSIYAFSYNYANGGASVNYSLNLAIQKVA
jgi:hypothetical protein